MSEPLEGEAAIAALRDYLARYRIPFEVIEDPKSPQRVTVMERLTGKSVHFSWGAVKQVEEAKNLETGAPYVRVVLDDGRRFAFAAAGIVFAPSFHGTGPVPDCPSAACFADFQKLFRHAEHLAADDHLEEHKREALQTVMVLLAFLEGARLAGIDVAEEEKELEAVLEKLDKKR